MMLEASVPLTGQPNALRSVLGDGLFAYLYDLFQFPEGPRLRGRLSHGDAQLQSVPPSLVGELELLLYVLCVPHSPATSFLASYAPRYHPKAQLRTHIIAVQLDSLHDLLASLQRDLEELTSSGGGGEASGYVESLRHVRAWEAQRGRVELGAVPPPLNAASVFGSSAESLARIVCLRKLLGNVEALASALHTRASELRRACASGNAGRVQANTFDRLVPQLPCLVRALGGALRWARLVAPSLLAESASLPSVKLLQQAAVQLEKALAPVQAHEWAKALVLMERFASMIEHSGE